MAPQWLKCDIQKGMFSDEVAVTCPTRGSERGKHVSVFVPRGQVRGDVGQKGRVRVQCFERDDVLWCVLPAENQPVISVNQDDLVAP
jgi:hypothetical protein